MTDYKTLDKLKLKEQECVIMDGMIHLRLDRMGDKPCIKQIPLKHKDAVIQDIWASGICKVYDHVSGKKTRRKFQFGKFWLYNPETDKFMLLDASLSVMICL